MTKKFQSGTEPDNNREECRMKPMKELAVAALIASTASFVNGSVLAQTLTIGLGTEPTSIDPSQLRSGTERTETGPIFIRP